MKSSFVCAMAAAIALSAPAQASNLVVNGDFESGNTGFTSDYRYNPGSGGPPSVYTVGTNPRAWNGAFSQIGDHTSGSGQMMIVNGSTRLGDIVWASPTINLLQNTDYFFEAFVASVFVSSPPILTYTFALDGGPETTLATLPNTLPLGQWEGFSNTFNSGAASSVQLFLRNANTAFGGNDFAVDDIYLGTTSIVNPPPPVMGGIPEPTTWAMMIIGFGAVGSSMRRHKASARMANVLV